jgi:NADH dehydrogenase FAD-containing subunit
VLLCGKRLQDVQPDHIVLDDGTKHVSDMTIISAGVTADDEAHHPHLTFQGNYTALESDNIYLAGDVAVHGLIPTAHNAFFEGRRA